MTLGSDPQTPHLANHFSDLYPLLVGEPVGFAKVAPSTTDHTISRRVTHVVIFTIKIIRNSISELEKFLPDNGVSAIVTLFDFNEGEELFIRNRDQLFRLLCSSKKRVIYRFKGTFTPLTSRKIYGKTTATSTIAVN